LFSATRLRGNQENGRKLRSNGYPQYLANNSANLHISNLFDVLKFVDKFRQISSSLSIQITTSAEKRFSKNSCLNFEKKTKLDVVCE